MAIENDDNVSSEPLYPGYGAPAPYIPPDLMSPQQQTNLDIGKATEQPQGSATRKQPIIVTDLITDFSPNVRLSPNFTVGSLSTSAAFPHTIRAQKGLTELQIAQALQYVAVNILEPIAEAYGRQSFIITSGFRPGENQSQHGLGEAVDIQFANLDYAQYRTRAQELTRLISFDQMLLETATDARRPWIHISFGVSRDNNKNIVAPRLRYQFATFHNHRLVAGTSFSTV